MSACMLPAGVSFEEIIERARVASVQSPCRSKRGVVLWSLGGIVSVGFNGPPRGFSCQCGENCAKTAVHAEDRAINAAHCAVDGMEMLHVKTIDGKVVASGGPSCWQCSRKILDVGIAAIWLIHEDGPKRYPADVFHRLTLAACGLD